MARIGFIGLGNMGLPIAANLAESGHTVKAFDISKATIKNAEKRGCIAAHSPLDAVVNSEFVFTMLPAGIHVRDILLDHNKLFEYVASGTTFIDCSSIDVITAQELNKAAVDMGLHFIDAPVSGGTKGAINGTLSIMVGATEAEFETVRPLLACFGKNIFHAGGSGSGQTAKACNNLLLAILMAGSSEVLNLGIKSGLCPKTLSTIIEKSSGSNWVMNQYNPVPGIQENSPATNNYNGGFMVDLMCKDLGLASAASKATGAPMPIGSFVKTLFTSHQCKGYGSTDFSSIYCSYEKDFGKGSS